MKNYITTIIFSFLISISLYGQDVYLPYESRMVDLGEIQIEYMDFGGKGPPFIWVQDFHNYFEGPYKDSVIVKHISEIAQHARVLAPLRRGYGRSTNTEWGYDVATQAEDLLGFMDALGIEKAVLFGRLPANQDMTWVAEHHPERLAGLIYWGNPVLIAGCSNPDVLALIENWSAMAPDFEKEKEKRVVMSRAFWRPHFLSDPSMRIDIPTLRFTSEFDQIYIFRRMVESGRIENLIKKDLEGFVEEISALRDIVSDSSRYATLKKDLIVCDQTVAINQGMERVFGNNLQTIEDSEIINSGENYGEYLNWLLKKITPFLEKIKD